MNLTEPATQDPAAQDKAVDAACANVTTELARTDTKASLLLAFDGAALAGLAALVDSDHPLPAQLAGTAAGLALAAAAVLLLLVVRPNLGGRRRTVREGFPCWAELDEDALHTKLREDHRVRQTRALSVIAVTKYRRLAAAVDALLTALALLLAAAVLAASG
ncbi:Pycsar system effector family protein [Streptomyces qinglanensis]|uniref:Pycsar system effector family protein n=1 Tax=Streptomyces qinglanensis TaxID=943816 RepID=UPI00378A1082